MATEGAKGIVRRLKRGTKGNYDAGRDLGIDRGKWGLAVEKIKGLGTSHRGGAIPVAIMGRGGGGPELDRRGILGVFLLCGKGWSTLAPIKLLQKHKTC